MSECPKPSSNFVCWTLLSCILVWKFWTDQIDRFPHSVTKSGSFIRYSPTTVSTGQSFLSALLAKYVDASISAPLVSNQNLPADNSRESSSGASTRSPAVESIVLGSSKGLIEVEAPNLDRVRRKVANIERLKEMSLDGEDVALLNPDDDSTWKLCRSKRASNLMMSGGSRWLMTLF